jgi:hypothetical protein
MEDDMGVCEHCPKKGCGSYHDVCPDYQAEKAERDKVFKEKCAYNDTRTYIVENSLRIKKAMLKKKYHSKGAEQ